MNLKEELTNLLAESYDRGVEDAKQEALIALEKVVAVAVAKEREAVEDLLKEYDMVDSSFAKDFRARLQPKKIKAVQEDDYCYGDERYYAND